MKYTAAQMAVLKEFSVVDAKGEWIYRKLIRPEASPLGYGPKVDPSVIDKLFSLDPTEVWLKWILHQAMGGDRAKESSLRAMEQMKQRFLDERLHGYQHAKTREVYPPVDKSAAEDRWKSIEDKMGEVLVSADQDTVEKLGVWGFFRDWPGNQGIYQKVYEVFKAWRELQPQLLQMNKELERESKPALPTTPKDIADIEAMENLCKKVVRYFASKVARDDIRLASWRGNDWIYNDDVILALCPLTYAASVRYGCDAWPFSNRDSFERLLLDDNAFSDNWGTPTQKGMFWVFLRFKVPMPRWVSRKQNQFFVYELTHLAVELRKPFKEFTFIDEEGQARSLGDVIDTVRHEVTRSDDPTDAEMPVKRGPNVYTSMDEAEKIIAHLAKALEVVREWVATFDTSRIKATPLDYKTKGKPSLEQVAVYKDAAAMQNAAPPAG